MPPVGHAVDTFPGSDIHLVQVDSLQSFEASDSHRMRCPLCFSPDTRVVDKRDSTDGSTTRRRRECATCERRFTTYERPEIAVLSVVKRDRRRQEFDPRRLRHSIALACTKRPISADTIDRIVEQIEAELRGRDAAEVQSQAIGDLVMEKLRQVDHVAYIRFASVYRQFADISSFEDELRNLLEKASEGGKPLAGTSSRS